MHEHLSDAYTNHQTRQMESVIGECRANEMTCKSILKKKWPKQHVYEYESTKYVIIKLYGLAFLVKDYNEFYKFTYRKAEKLHPR